MTRILAALCLFIALAGCGADDVWAPEEAVQAAVYRHNAPPSITLITAINNRSGEGGHSAIVINASQRVLFDPAGSWWHRTVPERHDVHFGMTPLMMDYYIDYHARETYHVVIQEKIVSPEVAQEALRLVMANGAVPKAMCSNSITNILGRLPGFESVSRSWFPGKTMERFGALPGVTTRKVYDDSPDDNANLLAVN